MNIILLRNKSSARQDSLWTKIIKYQMAPSHPGQFTHCPCSTTARSNYRKILSNQISPVGISKGKTVCRIDDFTSSPSGLQRRVLNERINKLEKKEPLSRINKDRKAHRLRQHRGKQVTLINLSENGLCVEGLLMTWVMKFQ